MKTLTGKEAETLLALSKGLEKHAGVVGVIADILELDGEGVAPLCVRLCAHEVYQYIVSYTANNEYTSPTKEEVLETLKRFEDSPVKKEP